jgi:hypothetical protein
MLRPGDMQHVCIPKHRDGRGYAWFKAQHATVQYFGMDRHPLPQDGPFRPAGSSGYVRMTIPLRGKDGGERFRIAIPDDTVERGYRLARFRLSDHATNDTLLVVSDLLDQGPAPWMFLTNGDGARLSRSLFHSRRWLQSI